MTRATCLSDIEAMTAQEEIFGPGGGASDSTMVRTLDELAERLGRDGMPRRRLARATAAARARAWAAIVIRPATEPGGTPRPVLVVRLRLAARGLAAVLARAVPTGGG